jgi:FKBP-type peptidyl-prolyl cis-trans isomerase 2
MKCKTSILVLVILLTCLAGVAAARTFKIGRGNTVTYHYTLSVDGEVVETTQGKAPAQYTHGKKMLLSKLEEQLKGMKAGDRKTILVNAVYAYGLFDPDLIMEVPREQMPAGMDIQKGMVLKAMTPDGFNLPGVVLGRNETLVFVNFNHPLAGMDLTFDISIVDVK